MFMPDKSCPTVCRTVRAWYNANRAIIKKHGGWEIGRFDNGTEFTPPDGAK